VIEGTREFDAAGTIDLAVRGACLGEVACLKAQCMQERGSRVLRRMD